MSDPRITKLAQTLVNYSVKVQSGQWVLIRGHVLALPLVEAVYEQVLKAGANATVNLDTDSIAELYFEHASDAQLDWVSPANKLTLGEADALIALRAAENTRGLTNADPAKQQRAAKARAELQKMYMARAAKGELAWVVTQFPCQAYAQEANMSLREYEDFVYGATAADHDDPLVYWRGIHDMQQKLVDYLKGKSQVTVKGPNIDMRLSIEGRTFINSDGTHNMPSGEIFTGPVEDSVEGWVRFTYPAIRGGRSVEGIELRFEKGKVVEAKADKNEDYLLSQLDSDAGARYLGEFAIGTNFNIKQFTGSILYDEKIGGTLHMAVGAGYPETGSKNESAVHWDMICDMREDSEIHVDGELFYKNGQFQV